MAVVVDGLPQDQHDYGMARGHSPVAEKVAAIDFDGTLVPWGPLMGHKDPERGAAEAIAALRRAGYRIVIFTSRLSQKWARSVLGIDLDLPLTRDDRFRVVEFLEQQRQYVADILTKGGIEFDDITAEKVPAEFYIDDKAFRYEGDWRVTLNAAIARAKGTLFYHRMTNRGRRWHRVVRIERAPSRYAWGRRLESDHAKAYVRFIFACGDFEEQLAADYDFGTNPATVKRLVPTEEVIGRLLDRHHFDGRWQPMLSRDFQQPMCGHCAKSRREPEELAA